MPTKQQDEAKKKELRELRKKQKEIKNKSLIIVNTGNGKGKTTAAMGIVFRMIAHGRKVAVVQFIKNQSDFKYGEHKLAQKFDNLEVFTMGAGFTWNTQNRDLDIQTTLQTFEKAKELILSEKYDLVVLDEVNYVVDFGFLPEENLIELLSQKPKKLHLILTGRNATMKVIEKADLVTEMQNIKHPFEKGILAQKGIEW